MRNRIVAPRVVVGVNPSRTTLSIILPTVALAVVAPLAVTAGPSLASTVSAPSAARATTTATTATAAPAATAADVPTVLHWRGHESKATLPLGPDKLPGAPTSFRAYVRTQLRETWQTYLHGRPACKGAPLMDVRHLRTDGFAFGYAGTYPRPGCQTGGGYQAFWAIRKGEWKQVIGTQDVPSCQRLEKLDFPSSVATTQCYDGHEVIDYQHD